MHKRGFVCFTAGEWMLILFLNGRHGSTVYKAEEIALFLGHTSFAKLCPCGQLTRIYFFFFPPLHVPREQTEIIGTLCQMIQMVQTLL